jgi:hypothetical protein
MVKISNKSLNPEFKNEMIKTSWVSLTQAFEVAQELEKHAEQKALEATKIYETSVDYMSTTAKKGNQGAPRGQKGRGVKSKENQSNANSSSSTSFNNKCGDGAKSCYN